MESIDRKTCKKKALMCGLVYPSVLGSALCSFLNEVTLSPENWGNWPYFLLMLVILAFYATDYLYTSLHQSMSWSGFFFNLLQIVLLFVAFKAIEFHESQPMLWVYDLSLAATFLIFVFFDHSRPEDYGNFTKPVVTFEVGLCLLFVGLAVFDAGLTITVIVSIASYALMLFFASTAYYHQEYSDRLLIIRHSILFAIENLRKRLSTKVKALFEFNNRS